MPDVTVLFGDWVPDLPSYQGQTLQTGGVAPCKEAHGVYATIGGYRPLITPRNGTLIGAFDAADFSVTTDWTPENLSTASVPFLWLDDEDAATITGSPEVTQWDNKIAGATQHATTAGGRTGPQLDSGAMTFDDGESLQVSLGSEYTGSTMWAIMYGTLANNNNAATALAVTDSPYAAGVVELLRKRPGQDKLQSDRFGAGGTSPEGAVSYATAFIAFVCWDGAGGTMRINGTQTDAELHTPGATFQVETLILGDADASSDGDPWGGGQIREVVFGTGTLATGEKERLEGWLACKRSAQSLLPTAHPYKVNCPQVGTTNFTSPSSILSAWSGAGNPYTFVAGPAKIWRLQEPLQTFDDVTNTGADYNASIEEPIQFAQFGDNIIAVNINDAPQLFVLGTSTDFADLSGTPPKARAIAQVRDFIMLGATVEGSTRREYRVRWSGFNDITDWTTDPGGTQADFQDLDSAYGAVTAIVGGEFATVFQRRAISRFSYVGPPAVFQVDTLETQRGCLAPLSVIRVGRLIYFYSQDGFYAFDGVQSFSISEGIKRWVRENLTDAQELQIRVGHDAKRRIIIWSWPYDPTGQATQTSGINLIYSYDGGKWSYNLSTDFRWFIGTGAEQETFVDGIDGDTLIDTSSVLIDSLSHEGVTTRPVGLWFEGDYWRLSAIDGDDALARVETAKLTLTPNRRTLVHRVRPLGNFTPDTTPTLAVLPEVNYASNKLSLEVAAQRYGVYSHASGMQNITESGRFLSFMLEWEDTVQSSSLNDYDDLTQGQGVHTNFEPMGEY